METVNLTNGRAAKLPASKGEKKRPEETEMDDESKFQYRQAVGKLLFYATERLDIQFPLKELSRGMSSPNEADWIHLKRLGRICQQKKIY